jgi:asparagine synthase (glutamine-hydrolysing)
MPLPVENATAQLSLRGPDFGAVFCKERIGLGHRRLSIIDTSAVANQPMTDPSGRYVIVYNGEIFNYKELATKYLTGKWNGPSTHSDTEVLLHLLINYKEDCLNWLSGFFVFAFYDLEEETLLIARDRFGKKPLVYYSCDKYFAFASEIKALVEYGIPRKLNYNALYEYLQLNYTPPAHTMLMDVFSLPAGCYIAITGSDVVLKQYYTVSTPPDYNIRSYEEVQTQLHSLVDAAVKERMIADVPLGAFLSGGIDSSVVVALASGYTDQLKTFSIGYADHPFFDETAYAKLVAEKYKTEHTVFNLGNQDLLENVDNVLDYFDQPLADPSCIPLYILCKLSRKEITVGLTGDGADEVFGGYNKHKAEYKARQKNLIAGMVTAGNFIWKKLPQGRDSKLSDLVRQLNRFAEGQKLSNSERYWRWAAINGEDKTMSLLHADKRALINMNSYLAHKQQFISKIDGADLNQVFMADVNMVLSGNMLPKVDLMSMANSLELRSPFLSHAVVDFAFTLPPEYKVNGKMKKRIVQDTFRELLPPELYNRPKHGFDVPMQHWFQHEMKTRIFDELLSEKNINEQGIFSIDAIRHLKAQLFSNNPGDSVNTIWALVVFQHWYNKYLA